MVSDGIGEKELKKLREEYLKTNKFCFYSCPQQVITVRKKYEKTPPKDMEKQKEAVRKWHETHKERMRKLRRNWEEKHKDEIKEKRKQKRKI